MPLCFDDPQERVRAKCKVLMLCDNWGGWTTGIASINQQLTAELADFSSVSVYCVVLVRSDLTSSQQISSDSENEPTQINTETGRSVSVQLIRVNLLSRDHTGNESEVGSGSRKLSLVLQNALRSFNNNPAAALYESPDADLLPKAVDFIIGHAPISAEAAVRLRQLMYPDSKVIQFYHCIPNEQQWISEDGLICTIPETEELVRVAEVSNVVYSVTPKVYAYFAARFRAPMQARVKIDHRLMMPLCSKDLFDVNGSALRSRIHPDSSCYCMATFAYGAGVEEWMGVDIAIKAAEKLAKVLSCREDQQSMTEPSRSRPYVFLTVLNIDPSKTLTATSQLQKLIRDAENAGVRVKLHESSADRWQAGPYRQLTADVCYDLVLLPTRSEPYGPIGHEALSTGIPTLVAETSALASLINRLMPDAANYIVPTTKDVRYVSQDASEWCRRILEVFDNPLAASEQALMLQGAMKRDELSRDTHDNLISFCLGGIGLKFELTELQFVSPVAAGDAEPDASDGGVSAAAINAEMCKEGDVRRRFNSYLLSTVRQCWRVKRHPLQATGDLVPLSCQLPQLPTCPLIKKVIDVIEENDRRIVAIDCNKRTVVVNCPDIYALRDLWAMCDRINAGLRSVLLPTVKDHLASPLMIEYGLRKAVTRVSISGPEYLQYRNQLSDRLHRSQASVSLPQRDTDFDV